MGCLVLIGFCTLPTILALSLATIGGGDYFALAIFFFFIFCLVACVWGETSKYKRQEEMKKAAKEQKKQDKYDNDWGTINTK